MKDLILRLASVFGPAGREDEVRAAIAREVAPWTAATATDALGNLLVRLRPAVAAPGPQSHRHGIVLAAGMDTPGGIVTEIADTGLLRFALVGDWPVTALAGQTVRFRSGVVGVIGAQTAGTKDLKASDCWLEIGADSGVAAREIVREGEFFVAGVQAVDLGSRVAGVGIGARAAAAALITAARNVAIAAGGQTGSGPDLHLAFTVQGSIEPRGLRTCSYQVPAALGVVVGAVPSGGREDGGVHLGAGPVLVLKDAHGLTPPGPRSRLEAAAAAAGVSIQVAVLGHSGPDLGLATLAAGAGGIGTAAVGLPVRFFGTPAEVVAVDDVEGAAAWLEALLRSSDHPMQG